MLMSAPAKREDKPFIPKQDAMIEFKEERKLTRRERRECKKQESSQCWIKIYTGHYNYYPKYDYSALNV